MLGAIGDTLLASAVVFSLRREYPAARFVWFVNASNQSIADCIAGTDQVVVLPLNSPFRALNLIRAHRFDILFDFGPWPRISAIFAALARARFAIGFRTRGQARHYAFDLAIPHSSQCHEIENFHALAAPFLNGIAAAWPHLSRPGGPSALPHGRRWIVFHPWPAGYKHHWRAWPEDRWLTLGGIVTGWEYSIAITGGPSDIVASRALAAKLGPSAVSLAGTSFLETIKVLADAAAIVAVNTGVMHLAAALDRPLVALHGPTDPKRWGPLSSKAVVVGPGAAQGCAYLNLGFEYPENPPDCMG